MQGQTAPQCSGPRTSHTHESTFTEELVRIRQPCIHFDSQGQARGCGRATSHEYPTRGTWWSFHRVLPTRLHSCKPPRGRLAMLSLLVFRIVTS
eukprot:5639560-Amphidinium_carterae.1